MPRRDANTTPVEYTEEIGGATVAENQIDITTAATLIIAANTERDSVVIKNLSTSTQTVFLGHTNTVTALTGHALDPGEPITYETSSALYGIVATGTARVSYSEEST
jgi:hypothetical protein